MQRNGSGAARFAERRVQGVGDDGADDQITIWIERRVRNWQRKFGSIT